LKDKKIRFNQLLEFLKQLSIPNHYYTSFMMRLLQASIEGDERFLTKIEFTNKSFDETKTKLLRKE
jgi:hypothetical protein